MKFTRLFLILFFVTPLWAQTNFLPLTADYATFRGNDGHTFVEVYFTFYQSYLTYQPADGKLRGEYLILAEILKGDSVVARDAIKRYSEISDTSEIQRFRQFMNQFTFSVKPGNYILRAVLRDVNSDRWGEFQMDIHAPEYAGDSLLLSDVQLGIRISRSQEKNEFTKNSFMVIPNPTLTYSVNLPVLYYYLEGYNMEYDSLNPGVYVTHCWITDNKGDTVRNYPAKTHTKPGRDVVIVGGYNIVTLHTGVYLFHVQVQDRERNESQEVSRRFTFLKPGETLPADTSHKVVFQSTPSANLNRVFQHMSEQELDSEFESAKFIATDKEKQIYKTLNLQGKRDFLEEFWKKRDTDTTTPVNEFRQEYLERVRYADQYFGRPKTRGCLTDRGRVLLTYGRPSEIERHYMDIDAKPYEIWYYNELEGGVIFVFGDLTGFGDFQLIHSTHSKELYQPNWQQLIFRSGTPDFFEQH